jgi:hypothetical protein
MKPIEGTSRTEWNMINCVWRERGQKKLQNITIIKMTNVPISPDGFIPLRVPPSHQSPFLLFHSITNMFAMDFLSVDLFWSLEFYIKEII